MDVFNLVVKWFHVMSAVIGLGGIFYAWLVVSPLTASNQDVSTSLSRRFGKVFGVCLALLLVTGLYNISYIAPRMEALYNILFGIKFMLSLLLFGTAFALFHPAKAFEKMKLKQSSWLTALAILGIAIIALSVTMNSARVWHLPQKDTTHSSLARDR